MTPSPSCRRASFWLKLQRAAEAIQESPQSICAGVYRSRRLLRRRTCRQRALLRELASLMLSMRFPIRRLLARLGGDEFDLLLPGCNSDSARFVVNAAYQHR